jgi:hypothetical protein
MTGSWRQCLDRRCPSVPGGAWCVCAYLYDVGGDLDQEGASDLANRGQDADPPRPTPAGPRRGPIAAPCLLEGDLKPSPSRSNDLSVRQQPSGLSAFGRGLTSNPFFRTFLEENELLSASDEHVCAQYG